MVDWAAALLVAGGAVGLVALVMLLGRREGAKGLPGTTEYPLIGAVLAVDAPYFQSWSYDLCRAKGFRTLCMSFFTRRVVIVTSDPRDVEVVLGSRFDEFEKGPSFRETFFDLLGFGIFNADGKLWRDQRKSASHLFATGKLKAYQDTIFKADALRLAEILREKRGEVVDVQNLMYALTMDSFTKLAFGTSFDVLRQTAEHGVKPKFLQAFDDAVFFVSQRFPKQPYWKAMRVLGLGTEARVPECIAVIDATVMPVVDEVLALDDTGLAKRSDLLALYVQFARKNHEQGMLERKYLRDVVVNFILAGRDTTACTLTSLFRLLAHRDDERARLEAEVAGMADVTYAELTKAEFLDAVIHETLRLFPPVASDNKSLIGQQPITLPSGAVVDPGNIVQYKINCVQRNPAYWSRPDDFVPQRWIDKNGDKDAIFAQPAVKQQYYFPAFHAGRRICLGKHMALVEAKNAVAVLLRAGVRFELPNRDSDDLQNWRCFTATPVIALRDGLKMRVQ